MVCRRGGVKRDMVGPIRILYEETMFEVSIPSQRVRTLGGSSPRLSLSIRTRHTGLALGWELTVLDIP